MKYVCFLTVTLSFTSAVILPGLSAEPHENKLQRRVKGNLPGHPDYYYRDDPNWEGNLYRGGVTKEDLNAKNAREQKRLRQSHSQLRPHVRDPPVVRMPQEKDYFARTPKAAKNRRSYDQSNPSYSNLAYRSSKHRADTRREQQAHTMPRGAVYDSANFVKPFSPPAPRADVRGGQAGRHPVIVLSPKVIVERLPRRESTITAARGPAYQPPARDSLKVPSSMIPVPYPMEDMVYQTRNGLRVVFRDGEMYRAGSRTVLGPNEEVYLVDKKRRSFIINEIDKSANTPSNSTESLQAEWQDYYGIYQSLQVNATNLIAPVINGLLETSNVSYYYEMAWAIESQLIGGPNQVMGPYLNGLTFFDDFEDAWLLQHGFLLDGNGTIYEPFNGTIGNATMLEAVHMLTINTLLKDTYYKTWDAAINAVNVTVPGSNYTVLEDLVYFANVLTATNDTQIVPAFFSEIDSTASQEDAAWFLPGLNA